MDLKKLVSAALKRFKLQANQWKKWTNRQVTEKIYENLMKIMKFGKKAIEIVEKQILSEAKDYTDNGFPIINLWIFYNVLTWYISHRAVSLNHRVELERRLRSAIASWK